MPATQQDMSPTLDVHQALAAKQRLPKEHLVDTGYIDAEGLVEVKRDYGVQLAGPPRGPKGWQSTVSGAFTAYDFTLDWEPEWAVCPNSKASIFWKCYHQGGRYPRDLVEWVQRSLSGQPRQSAVAKRTLPKQVKTLNLQPEAAFEALKAART